MPDTPILPLNELRPGSMFRHYRLLEQIGSGGQGVVWSASDAINNRIVAIKLNEVPKTDREIIDDMMFERQTGKLLTLSHPNVLPIYDIGLEGDIRYQVSPYISGGSLTDLLGMGALPLQKILHFAGQIASALDYLHGQEVVHRDLKPGNILLDLHQNVFVADFGLARVISDTTSAMHTGRGTPPYSPPEQHTLGRMTPQADIYSFGVMLYEMFTGQLPWNGDKVLGMQQLTSQEEIPDPREINPSLPAALVVFLRYMTAADPAARPSSASEAVRALEKYFTTALEAARVRSNTATVSLETEAQQLLQQSMLRRGSDNPTVNLSLTRFAVIDLNQQQAGAEALSTDTLGFMLQNALIYGHNDDYWWKQIARPLVRLNVAANLVSQENEIIAERVINHILGDTELHSLKGPIPDLMTACLIDLAGKASNPFVRQECLETLRILLPGANEWQATAFSPEKDERLAMMALQNSPEAEEAALLIGHLRSSHALQSILNAPDKERRMSVLMAIRNASGSLPLSTPLQIRTRVSIQLILQRLLARPLTLLKAYSLAALGMMLGFGLHVALSLRLPKVLDMNRITVSLEQGLLMGALFGFGLFLTRLVAERVSVEPVFLRMLLATFLGGAVLNGVMVFYDVVYLYRIPSGVLTTAACLLTAMGFALGALKNARLWRIGISSVAFFAALAGSWWVHVKLAASPTALSPLFFYEYTWPAAWVLGTMLVLVLLTSVFGNLVDLSYQGE